jgi:hypothetical protein
LALPFTALWLLDENRSDAEGGANAFIDKGDAPRREASARKEVFMLPLCCIFKPLT